ncbi:MAG: endonuclease III [Candidatus Altiarchaeales archaeon]|nr:MAG: endonuclease III [Candidatus Altiarchaeales archaeon]
MKKVNNKEKILEIIKLLKKEYPEVKIALEFKNPLELLVATMLSAQCTDERVNIVTKDLFKKYKTAEDYANADLKELERDIKSTGFYKNKAKNIKNTCRILIEKYNSKVPRSMEEMLSLPGVARKTANIVLSNAYGIVEGIAVDTHVRRLSFLLGLTKEKDPVKIERDLMEIVPKKHWIDFPLMLILHGRKICIARRPRCEECILNRLCPSAFKI